MILLVDADYIVYQAGFACESSGYLLEAELPSGEVLYGHADTAAGAKVWLDRDNFPLGTKIREPERVVNEQPLSHAKQFVRKICEKIERQSAELYGKMYSSGAIVPPDEVHYYLTDGPTNYRIEMATIRPYKGNRASLHKPFWYKALREFLQECYNARMVRGCEADDQVLIDAERLRGIDDAIVASVDKDHRQWPGLLYNWRAETLELISEEEGLVNFYRQILKGDVTDNIVGCYKCGESRAHTLIGYRMNEEEMYAVCLEEFRKSMGRTGCPYAHLRPEDALLETARLVYLQRREDELWGPPGERDRPTTSDGADSSVASWLISRREALSSSTKPRPSRSRSRSRASSAKRAESTSPESPATPQTSVSTEASIAGPFTSKPKASSRRTSADDSRRSARSTRPASPSSSSETTG